MEQYQQFINGQLRNKILQELKRIRGSTEMYVGMNYKIHYPSDGFSPGSEVYIPITTPSDSGPLYIGNAVLSIGLNNEILSVGYVDNYIVDEHGVTSLDVYREGEFETEKHQTLTSLLSKTNIFLSKMNSIISSNQVQYLLEPKINSDMSLFSRMGGGQSVSGHPADGRQIRINNSSGIPGPARKWSDVRSSNIEAEMVRVSSIKSEKDRQEYITEALASLRLAPSWYSMLGGKTKDSARDKIVGAYMKACEDNRKAIPASAFFEKLRRIMFERNQLAGFCERDGRNVNGTINNECLNKSCSSYRTDCPKFSYRLNSF